MLGWFRRKGITSSLLMLGCSLGLGCVPATTEQPETSKTEQPEPLPKVSVPSPTPTSPTRQYTIFPYAELNSEFLEEMSKYQMKVPGKLTQTGFMS